jgi:hypothetical protein
VSGMRGARLALGVYDEASRLGKVVALAATSEDDVHSFLMKRCPFYTAVVSGDNAARMQPDAWCDGHDDEGGQVAMTPRTPEASTVPEPIGKPGGPGLWHVKGMQLPPYVQHLAHHLIGKYGESRGIAMAKGIVAKWAMGVNPGGKHPTKTHADVRAAAQKNIAEWEQKRARAHAQSREKSS